MREGGWKGKKLWFEAAALMKVPDEGRDETPHAGAGKSDSTSRREPAAKTPSGPAAMSGGFSTEYQMQLKRASENRRAKNPDFSPMTGVGPGCSPGPGYGGGAGGPVYVRGHDRRTPSGGMT